MFCPPNCETAEAIAVVKFIIELIVQRKSQEISCEAAEQEIVARASEKEIKAMLEDMKLPHSFFYRAWQSGTNILNENRYLKADIQKDKTRVLKINYDIFKRLSLGVEFTYPLQRALKGKLPKGREELKKYFHYKDVANIPKQKLPLPLAMVLRPKQPPRQKTRISKKPNYEQRVSEFIESFGIRGCYRSNISGKFRKLNQEGDLRIILITLQKEEKITLKRRGPEPKSDVFVATKHIHQIARRQ